MEYDKDKVDKMALALMYLTTFDLEVQIYFLVP